MKLRCASRKLQFYNAATGCDYKLARLYMCAYVFVQMPGWPEPHNGFWLLRLFPVVVSSRFFESCSAGSPGGRFKPIIRAGSVVRSFDVKRDLSCSSMVPRNELAKKVAFEEINTGYSESVIRQRLINTPLRNKLTETKRQEISRQENVSL